MRADPAGALVYPGATLTHTSDASHLSEFTRTYSLTTGATAKEIIERSTQMIAPYGYEPAKVIRHPIITGPRRIYAEYQGRSSVSTSTSASIERHRRGMRSPRPICRPRPCRDP